MDDEKKYKEALKKLQEALAPKDGCEISGLTRACIEEIFPELAESEDEKIRKSIIENLKGNMYRADGDYDLLNKQISWLEKQGKKTQGKSALEAVEEEKVDNANKVKPKFHEGEWIVWQDKCCKVNYNGCGYELIDQNGLSTSLEYGTVDENAHIWSITKDAEDGDVLVSNNIIFIFNRIHDIWIKCHCSLYEDDSFYGGDFDLMPVHYGKQVFPATKEQCDKLLKAMANAGYEWDAEKKELKKIESNSAWSEEDDYNLQCMIAKVTSDIQKGNIGRNNELMDWLKSLKGRCTWKPSNIQMECLHDAVEHYHTNGYPASKLNELYEQMSKIYKL